MSEHDEQKSAEAYAVGYGKPPMNSRFKKGQSGNPSGRLRGIPNFKTVLQRTLSERVVINEGGKRKTISKMKAFVKQLVHKAASGDLRATAQVTDILKSIEQNADRDAQDRGPNELDRKTILNLLKRSEKSTKE